MKTMSVKDKNEVHTNKFMEIKNFQLKWKSISWFWNREAVKSFSSYFSLGPTVVLAVDFCFWGNFSAHTSMYGGGFTVIWEYCLHDTCIEFLWVYHVTYMLGSYFTLIVDVFPLLSSLMRFCLSWQIVNSLLLNIQYWHGYLWMRWTYMLGILVSLGSSLNWELVYWFYNKVIIAVGHTTFILPTLTTHWVQSNLCKVILYLHKFSTN